ncbi:MAG: hypothetical protein JXB85_05760 [Anaerolineales bacterium]|nr:hypothetical protein [Anaerolineales bacterium]
MKSERRTPSPLSGGLLWNILTVVMLVGICCLGIFFLTIFVNPQASINPFPPSSLPTLAQFPTPTITAIQLDATWTPTSTIEPSPTRTFAATWTSVPTNTPYYVASVTDIFPTTTGTPSPTATGLPVVVNITYMDSSIYHPEAGCNWMGVAGQAVDKNNNPVIGLTIYLSGTLGGQPIERIGLTGTAPNYGASGFEFVLGDRPIASNDAIWIQLQDQAGHALTDKIYFDTFGDCTKNLVLVRFRQTR